MDEIFEALGVLFVIALVAQVFQKPEKRRARRHPGNQGRQVVPCSPSLFRRTWERLTRVHPAHLVTIGFIAFAVLTYLAHILFRPARF